MTSNTFQTPNFYFEIKIVSLFLICVALFTVSVLLSEQTTGSHGNLLVTKAVTKRFSVQCCITLCNHFHAINYKREWRRTGQKTHCGAVY